jgi:hypothetical protein
VFCLGFWLGFLCILREFSLFLVYLVGFLVYNTLTYKKNIYLKYHLFFFSCRFFTLYSRVEHEPTGCNDPGMLINMGSEDGISVQRKLKGLAMSYYLDSSGSSYLLSIGILVSLGQYRKFSNFH